MKSEKEQIKESVVFLSDNPNMYKFLDYFFSEKEKKELLKNLKLIDNKKDFIEYYTYAIFERLIEKTSSNFIVEGVENLDKNTNYLFISNHRNIVSDPALLNFIAVVNKLPYVIMAIGDNLMLSEFTNHYYYLTDCFAVKRGVTAKELLISSMEISNFIRNTVQNKMNSVWIANREGRTKYGKDKTQASIFKMLMMSSKTKDFKENLSELNIVPLAITYEYNPCDALFLYEKEQKGNKHFSQKRYDALSMYEGLIGKKGMVKYHFDKPLNTRMDSFNSLDDIVEYFDDFLHKNVLECEATIIAKKLMQNQLEAKTEKEKDFLQYAKRQLSRFYKLNQESLVAFVKYYADL